MEVNPDPTSAASGPRVSASGVGVRLVVAGGASLVLVAGGRVEIPPLAALLLGVVLALARPTTVGAWVALPAAAWSFVAAAGDRPGLGAVLLAAAGVYLLHTGVAASAVMPWSARLTGAATRRWLLRCLPAVVVTVALALVDDTLGPTPRSAWFAVVAGGVVIAAAVLLHRLLTTADPAD